MDRRVIKAEFQKDYNKLKNMAFQSFNQNKIKHTLRILKLLASLMNKYNIIYCDDELEDLIIEVSNRAGTNKTSINATIHEKRIVFYDYFADDRTCLALIYIRALRSLGYEILYIIPKKKKYSIEQIRKEIIQSEKSEIYILESISALNIVDEIVKKISGFAPSRILVQTVPNDVEGIMAMNHFEGICERFLINLTDHAFWLGKKSVDYFIEFRSYGYNISTKYRMISKDKLCILPYYPANYYAAKFQGLPFDESKKFIFSGGGYYKIKGSDEFYNIIKYIIDNHNDIIFLFAGYGDKSDFEKFIKENSYENRVFLLSMRTDYIEIMKRCYFYLSTYPLLGGLMTQYAVANKKIPLTLDDKSLPFSDVTSVTINSGDVKFVYSNKDELHEEIDLLIKDKYYLEQKADKLRNMLITENEFAKELDLCLKEHRTSFQAETIDIDTTKFSKIYFAASSYRNYCISYARTLNIGIAFKFPIKFAYGLLWGAVNKMKGYLKL